MKIENMNELMNLRHLLIVEFGSVPENITIESKSIVCEAEERAKEYGNQPAPYGVHSMKVHGINVVKQIAEVF